MAQKWPIDGTFHLGINMAGAVSAGAYTAGVLDFLMEALEQWYQEKAARANPVPMHDVSIDVFSGASAGGMCAAIASVMVQGEFEHIRNPADASVVNTTNKFYESWVNRIDIQWLLQDEDIQDGQQVISLLDSTVIDEIADYAITAGASVERPYISSSLNLFLALTNVRGVPFALQGNAEGSAEEVVAYYADRLQFEIVKGAADPLATSAHPLPVGANDRDWPLLKQAAKATGAFPIFLAPRKIDRFVKEYMQSPWEPVSNEHPLPVKPNLTLLPEDTYPTLIVDGGLTDNDPFQLAHDYLAIHNPLAKRNLNTGALENPRSANEANCSVLTVAPFPATQSFDPGYNFDKNSAILGMLPNLFSALIGQSRFLGESLAAVGDQSSYSRFVLAPSDSDHPKDDALQCGILGAFGGFFERGFRAHDYQLGRRNCQKFLRDHFRLAVTNPVIQAGMDKLTEAERAAVMQSFAAVDNSIPIIPLCGTAILEAEAPLKATISQTRVNHILNWIVDRLHAVTKSLLENSSLSDFDKFAARSAIDTIISTLGKAKLKAALQDKLQDVIAD